MTAHAQGPKRPAALWLLDSALWPYALLSLLFVGVHVYHNLLAHGLLGVR